MTDDAESRTHYRLNRQGLTLARQRLQELTDELCRVGVYAKAGVELSITDGIIADVRTVKETVDRIRRRRNGGDRTGCKESSLTGGGRQGDTPGKTKTPMSEDVDDRKGPSPSSSSNREDDDTLRERDET